MPLPQPQNDDYYASAASASADEAPKSPKKGIVGKLKIKAKVASAMPEEAVSASAAVSAPEPVSSPAQEPKVAPVPEPKAAPAILRRAVAPAISFAPAAPRPVREVPAASKAPVPAAPRADERPHGPKIESDAPAQRLRAFADNGNRLQVKGGPAISFSPAAPRPQFVSRPSGALRPPVRRPMGAPAPRPSGFHVNAVPGGIVDRRFKTPRKSVLRKPLLSASEEDDGSFKRSKKNAQASHEEGGEVRQVLVDKTGQTVRIPEALSVKEFSDKLGVPLAKVLFELMKNGLMANLNTKIDFDTCSIVADAFKVSIEHEAAKAASAEAVFDGNVADLLKDEDPAKLLPRPPTVTIMGHVDHGKTTLLDYIRKAKIAAGEAGGITQSIGAYQAEQKGKLITFLDTPGHAAFSLMRSRGVRLTDIVVLVVAADEGMKPQTVESLKLAQAANVQIIVAINKMDKPGANPDLVKTQLSENGLQPEDWGGTTPCIPVSAHTGLGMDDLLDMILLVAEMGAWKANPDRLAIATVVEAHLDPSQGPVATVLVNAGTLRKGDAIVSGSSHGRVKALRDFRGRSVAEARPGSPVFVSGLSDVVQGGDIVQAVKDPATASAMARDYGQLAATRNAKKFEGASLVSILAKIKADGLKQLKLVVKSDTNGSLEALRDALSKLSTEKVQVQVVHAGVGPINENDVLMAGTGQALLIGYNVDLLPTARDGFDKTGIELISDKVIYRILERVNAIATGMVDVEKVENKIGEATVKKIFYDSKELFIVGVGVTQGVARNKSAIKVVRGDKQVAQGRVSGMKHGSETVQEIEAGHECGISYVGDSRPQEGDTLEFYETVVRA